MEVSYGARKLGGIRAWNPWPANAGTLAPRALETQRMLQVAREIQRVVLGCLPVSFRGGAV